MKCSVRWHCAGTALRLCEFAASGGGHRQQPCLSVGMRCNLQGGCFAGSWLFGGNCADTAHVGQLHGGMLVHVGSTVDWDDRAVLIPSSLR
mgnify:CR=1 FL=1